jgi:hypothetical protein
MRDKGYHAHEAEAVAEKNFVYIEGQSHQHAGALIKADNPKIVLEALRTARFAGPAHLGGRQGARPGRNARAAM